MPTKTKTKQTSLPIGEASQCTVTCTGEKPPSRDLRMLLYGPIIRAGAHVIAGMVIFSLFISFLFGWIAYGTLDGALRFMGFSILFYIVSLLFAIPWFLGLALFVLELLAVLVPGLLPLSLYTSTLSLVGIASNNITDLAFWVISSIQVLAGLGWTMQTLYVIARRHAE